LVAYHLKFVSFDSLNYAYPPCPGLIFPPAVELHFLESGERNYNVLYNKSFITWKSKSQSKGLNPDKPEITNYKHHLILKLGK
jgi:hypothetical protein